MSGRGTFYAPFFSEDSSILQDPPGGGCDFSDVNGSGTAYYTNGVLTGTEVQWHAQTICTTTAAGQSMGGIIVNSSLWLNGSSVDTGTEFVCTNCNLGNSPGAWVGGPSASGTYWVGATFNYLLPDGWIWGTPGTTACNVSTTNTALLICGNTSGTMYFPPTN